MKGFDSRCFSLRPASSAAPAAPAAALLFLEHGFGRVGPFTFNIDILKKNLISAFIIRIIIIMIIIVFS